MSKLLAKRVLVPHPGHDHLPLDLGVRLTLIGSDVLKLEYVVVGPIADLLIPQKADPERRDGLWQHTCFEVFIGLADSPAYVEYNFAPSREWAAYRFDGYREGMAEAHDLPAPDIFVDQDGPNRFSQIVILDVSPLKAKWGAIACSAVIEAQGGAKSYWALQHPPGKPDFHHADCFALKLPAADAA